MMTSELFKLPIAESKFIQVISLWQPWASWVAWGWKTIETRTHNKFRNLAGKRIAIHAAKRWDEDWHKLAHKFLSESQVEHTLSARPLPFGEIICTVFVTEFIPLNGHHSKSSLIDCEHTERFGLVLGPDIQNLRPIPELGRQGIWTIPKRHLNLNTVATNTVKTSNQ
jgi:hypothetical protein